jgi:hypothetical protein
MCAPWARRRMPLGVAPHRPAPAVVVGGVAVHGTIPPADSRPHGGATAGGRSTGAPCRRGAATSYALSRSMAGTAPPRRLGHRGCAALPPPSIASRLDRLTVARANRRRCPHLGDAGRGRGRNCRPRRLLAAEPDLSRPRCERTLQCCPAENEQRDRWPPRQATSRRGRPGRPGGRGSPRSGGPAAP